MLRSSNPALNADTFSENRLVVEGAVMTLSGVAAKTALLLLILFAAATFSWNRALGDEPSAAAPWLIGGLLGGLALALVIIFSKTLAPYLSPVYAACEGLFLGVLSAMMEQQFPGVVVSAVGLTFGTLASLLALYSSGVIRASENFKLGVIAATGGIGLYYLFAIILGLLGMQAPLIHNTGPIGIGFSAFVVIIAALNLVLDFDFIERGVEAQAPKYLEWYAAFGLMVTLVWLYLEILRLLSKLRRR